MWASCEVTKTEKSLTWQVSEGYIAHNIYVYLHVCHCVLCVGSVWVLQCTLICLYMVLYNVLFLQSMFTQGIVMILQSVASGKALCINNGEVSGKGIRDGFCKRRVYY